MSSAQRRRIRKKAKLRIDAYMASVKRLVHDWEIADLAMRYGHDVRYSVSWAANRGYLIVRRDDGNQDG